MISRVLLHAVKNYCGKHLCRMPNPQNSTTLYAIYLFVMNQYDVVIIGAGLGGLLTGLFLAKEGRSVAIIEQNKQIGGCLQTFSFEKKLFDSCVHYIGAFDEGQTQHKLFDYAGILPDLQFEKMDEDVFDAVLFGDEDKAYPLAQGAENFISGLAAFFPDEQEQLRAFMKQMEDVGNSFPLYKLRMGEAGEKERYSNQTMQEGLGLIRNQRLRQVLTGNNLLYAGAETKTPFYVHALVSKSYIDSAYKCEGKSSRIAKALWTQLQLHGATIFRNEKVIILHEKGGVLTAAETASGMLFQARHFISNVHPAQTMTWLQSPLIKPVYRNRLAKIENSISAFMVNVVLKPGKVSNRNHNIYWNRSDNSFEAEKYKPQDWPANYALYYSRDQQQPAFAESVALLSYMHHHEVKDWMHTHNRTVAPDDRDELYQEFKKEKALQLIDEVAKRFPEIRQNMQSMKVATPLTFRDYMGSADGSMYGIMADVHQPEYSRVPIQTKIPNLLLTGQNTGLHGVLGVSITAVATAGHLVGLDHLLQKINKA